jgi:hypothetical protein
MSKSIKTQVAAIESNNAAEIILWVIVIVMGAFSSFGMFLLLWDVSVVAYVFTGSLFFAVACATPIMVLRAEKGNGKWQVSAFLLAGCLALIDWGAGYNAGIQVEREVMQETWELGLAEHTQKVTQANDDLSDAKENLQTAINERLAIKMPDTSEMGPQNTAAEMRVYETQITAADSLIAIAETGVANAQSIVDDLPEEYVRPTLFSHTFLGIVMAGLQVITLFGFVVAQRITRQRVEALWSTADEIERTVKRRVSARLRTRAVEA